MLCINDSIIFDFLVSQQYECEKKKLENMIEVWNNLLLKEYKRRFPFHLISQ